VQQYSRTGLGSMRRGMDAARHHRLDHALAGTTCPVLVLRGPADRICPQDWAERLGSGPARTCVTLGSGAHMVPLTHGDLVADPVAEFLATDT
jgi:pimeloyl-ACP methyl ester carboxylesterase